MVPLVLSEKADSLPLLSRTPHEWGHAALADPIALLTDHAFLEKKAALNAMELMTRWPGEWVPGWVEIMTRVARDEAAHLAQVVKILVSRGGHLGRLVAGDAGHDFHPTGNPFAGPAGHQFHGI